MREQSNFFRPHYVCDWVILPENIVRRSIFDHATIPNPSDTVKRGKAPKRRK
jgi:hypothetical protein